MTLRLVLVPLLVGACVVTATGAEAASKNSPKTLDGKKVSTLTLTASGGVQDNDSKNVTEAVSSPDRADCQAPRCAKLPFIYRPAKGVKGDVMFTISWSNPASDFDLYVADVAKDGSTSTLQSPDGTKYQCATSGGVGEKVFVPRSSLKPGKTYAMVVDFFRSVNDTVNGTVTMGPDTTKHTVPDQYDGKVPGTVIPVNCAQ